MATATAPRTLYTAAEGAATCRGCRRPLPPDAAPNRLFCDGCRTRRRIATFLRQAHDLALEIDDTGMARQIDGLIARTGMKRAP